jgi:hypothetical protein
MFTEDDTETRQSGAISVGTVRFGFFPFAPLLIATVASAGCRSDGQDSVDSSGRPETGSIAFSRATPGAVLAPADVYLPADADIFTLSLKNQEERSLTSGPGVDLGPT